MVKLYPPCCTMCGNDARECTYRLLATASSVAKLQVLVNEFYATNSYIINADLSLHHPTHIRPTMVRIIKAGRRYRFEAHRS